MDDQRSNNRLLPVVFTIAALLIGVFWAISWIERSPRVSLTFVDYKHWPSESIRYAELRLSNNTTDVVRYALMRDAPRPTCLMTLYREKTAKGWSEEKPEPETGGAIFSYRDLKPGQDVTFLVPIKPGALPKQVAIACEIPIRPETSRIKRELRPLLMRSRGALRIQSPRDDRVWCEKVLLVPHSRDMEASKGQTR